MTLIWICRNLKFIMWMSTIHSYTLWMTTWLNCFNFQYFVCSLSLKLTFWLLGACEGDSGSPVTRKISYSGRGRPFYQQEFIVSSGLDCRLRATIYTRVSQRKVLHWIQKISGTQPVVMVVGGFSSHTKEFLRAKAEVNTYILQGTITQSVPPIWKQVTL